MVCYLYFSISLAGSPLWPEEVTRFHLSKHFVLIQCVANPVGQTNNLNVIT